MGRAGFVLVGGRSARMGRDKALLPYRGATLLEHIAAQVRQAAGSVTLVGAPERYRHLPYAAIPDHLPGAGPAAGIHAALTATEADWNLIVACDMPALTAQFLRRLIEQAERTGGQALVPLSPSGRWQPLCAVYHRSSLVRFQDALSRGCRRLAEFVASLDVRLYPVPEEHWFINLNTPADWNRAACL